MGALIAILSYKSCNKDGNKRRTAEVVADNVYFADSKSESSTKGAPAAAAVPAPNPYGAYAAPPASNPYGGYAAPASDFAMLEDDDAQLPF